MSENSKEKQSREALPDKKFAAMLYIPLTIPAAIPIYFAFGQEEPAVAAGMVVFGIGILILNALLLVVIYRWLTRAGE